MVTGRDEIGAAAIGGIGGTVVGTAPGVGGVDDGMGGTVPGKLPWLGEVVIGRFVIGANVTEGIG